MEAIGLLVTLEARSGKEADAEAFLKSASPITRITYTDDEPPDYWAKRGYSRYDGI